MAESQRFMDWLGDEIVSVVRSKGVAIVREKLAPPAIETSYSITMAAKSTASALRSISPAVFLEPAATLIAQTFRERGWKECRGSIYDRPGFGFVFQIDGV